MPQCGPSAEKEFQNGILGECLTGPDQTTKNAATDECLHICINTNIKEKKSNTLKLKTERKFSHKGSI